MMDKIIVLIVVLLVAGIIYNYAVIPILMAIGTPPLINSLIGAILAAGLCFWILKFFGVTF